MLSPTGWWLLQEPVDLRCGMDRLLVAVQDMRDRESCDGGAYVFRNRTSTRIKVLCADAQGVWLSTRRLHAGHFVWPRAGAKVFALSAEQFSWLSMGVDWQRLSAREVFAKRV